MSESAARCAARDAAGLDGRHIRIAVRPPADNAVLLAAISEVLSRC